MDATHVRDRDEPVEFYLAAFIIVAVIDEPRPVVG
jgi:hypothetical protein